MLKIKLIFIIIKNGMVLAFSDSRNKPRECYLVNNLFACKMQLKLGLPNFYGVAYARASHIVGTLLQSMSSLQSADNIQINLLK